MTEQKITMTMEQVEQEMEEYRRIFDVVRLIEEETIQMMEEGREKEVDPEKVACYSFWKKNRQCKNCISARVLREKNQGTKLEFVGEDIYQVTACYMEIDGKAYVMELVKKLNEEFLLDAEGCEKLVRKLDGYNQDLYIDALTGSYNRRYYEERLKGKETSAGVAVIDLDDFKLWNDTYGHGTGDVVLQTVVKAIRQSTRKTDSLVRYGGDEFLLVMPDVSDEVFMKKAIELSRLAVEHGNEPFGAVLVKNNEMVFTNENQIYTRHDPTFHGEVGLIREFCAQTGITDLQEKG